MTFKLNALFFVVCVTVVRSAIIQSELPMPAPNHITTQEMLRMPQIPFQAIPSQGITVQQGDVQVLAPEDKLIPFDQLDSLFKATGLVTSFKGTSLKLIKKGIKLLAKVAVVAVIAFSVVGVSMLITSIFCKKTGLCEFKCHKFKFDKEQIEAVRSFVSDDHLTTLTKFVTNAIEENPKEE